jgi:extracellular elastinolytic metalloproteinase
MAAPDRGYPEDFHALYDSGFKTARGFAAAPAAAETAGHQKLRGTVPELAVDYDDATNLPKRVASERPDARLSAAAPGAPEDAVRQFIQQNKDLWNLADEDASAVDVVSVSRTGLKTVNLIQRVDGVEVFNSDITAAVSPNNEVISVAGQLFPGASVARAQSRNANRTPTEEAIARAASDLTSASYEPDLFQEVQGPPDSDPYRFYECRLPEQDPRPAFERPIRVKDVMFPLGEGQFVPGYYMELWIQDWPAYSYVIDAIDAPDVLFRRSLTNPVAFQYRVFNAGDAIFRPADGPAPGTPHPTGRPDGFQAPTIESRLIDIECLPVPGDPWLPDDARTTDGNNCIAYADLRPPNGFGPGDIMGEVSAPRTFDYTYRFAEGADTPTNLQASLVGMFFHVNWLHDRWYEAGFDEAAGNAQKNNFGRGGRGGDPILAEGNDFSGTDNANMSTPADGSSPRMQMFLFNGPTPARPSRTSNFEALITFHEMGHYITNRLVGNAAGLTNVQGRAMGEGWGDFFAICMTSQADDDFANGVFAVGGWTDVTSSFNNNYYFSIRRYPYSADMNKNPLTFKHISSGVTLPPGPPAGPPRNSVGGGTTKYTMPARCGVRPCGRCL